MTYKIYIGGAYPNGVINQITNKTLKESLVENGLVVVDEHNFADFYLSNDFTSRDQDKLACFARNRRILLVCEPKIVLPENYKSKIRKEFGLIISRNIKDKENYLQHPQYWERVVPDRKKRKNALVIINANKISLVKGNNYGLRKICSKKFPFVDLYGHDWDMKFNRKIKELLIAIRRNLQTATPISFASIVLWLSPNPKSLGIVESKSAVMSGYKYALIIENENTYVSEKIFDAFFSGCIPVYVGPTINNLIIPEELYISALPSVEGVRKSIYKVQEIDYEKWIIRLNAWLSSTETQDYWGESAVQKVLSKRIIEYITNVKTEH